MGLLVSANNLCREREASVSWTEATYNLPPQKAARNRNAPSDQHTDTLEDTEQDSATNCGSEHTFRSTCEQDSVISSVHKEKQREGERTHFGRQEYRRSRTRK